MLNTKTHFEQVPLEIVRKVVEEKIQQETAMEQDQEPRGTAIQENPLGTQEQSQVLHTFSQVGVNTIYESEQRQIQEHVQEEGRIRCPGVFRFRWPIEKDETVQESRGCFFSRGRRRKRHVHSRRRREDYGG
jgi:transcription initiation factor TFIID subunit TAF12